MNMIIFVSAVIIALAINEEFVRTISFPIFFLLAGAILLDCIKAGKK